jgi:hypothetical protein
MMQRETVSSGAPVLKQWHVTGKCNVKQPKDLRIKNCLSFNQNFQPGYDLGRLCYGTYWFAIVGERLANLHVSPKGPN